jgi:predicted HAD superfamily phosphohydrolase YqeG
MAAFSLTMATDLVQNGHLRPLLTEIGAIDTGRKCLVLDLDETLVHSSFKVGVSASPACYSPSDGRHR